jgi:hypothetical protein
MVYQEEIVQLTKERDVAVGRPAIDEPDLVRPGG